MKDMGKKAVFYSLHADNLDFSKVSKILIALVKNEISQGIC